VSDRRTGIAVTAAALAFVIAAGPWFGGDGGEPAPLLTPPEGPSASATPPSPTPVPELTAELGRVWGRGPAGRAPRRRLEPAAEAVGAALTRLYAAGFVDPAGRSQGLLRLFDPGVRAGARGDLSELTLGRTGAALEAVLPRRLRLDVRFVTDGENRPVAAFAHVDFAASGVAEGSEVPIRHGGRYVLRRSAGRWRIAAYDVRGRVSTPGEVRTEVRRASRGPVVPSRDPLFVLVIGSDARPGQVVERARADSVHLVGVNPRRDRASIVGIPRDTYVTIPGAGADKINAALVRGGPELVVATVERLTGIRIDGYLLTGFLGFERLVNAVGGLRIVVPYPMSDRYSHAQFRPGPEHVGGRDALAFSRNRHDARGGDFGRSLNQGRVLVAALRELQAAMRTDRSGLLPWVLAASRHLRTDLGFRDLIDLALAAERIDPDRVRNVVVPGRAGSAGGRSVVFLGEGAAGVFRDLAREGILGR